MHLLTEQNQKVLCITYYIPMKSKPNSHLLVMGNVPPLSSSATEAGHWATSAAARSTELCAQEVDVPRISHCGHGDVEKKKQKPTVRTKEDWDKRHSRLHPEILRMFGTTNFRDSRDALRREHGCHDGGGPGAFQKVGERKGRRRSIIQTFERPSPDEPRRIDVVLDACRGRDRPDATCSCLRTMYSVGPGANRTRADAEARRCANTPRTGG